MCGNPDASTKCARCRDMETANSSLLGLALMHPMPLLVSLPVPVGVAQVPAQLQGSIILQSAFGAGGGVPAPLSARSPGCL